MTNRERERDDEGRFKPDNPDEAYLDAVQEHEPAATREIAETVGVARQTADRRLRQLEEQGRVSSKIVGNSLIWMITTEE